jgi:type 1 glutamine amidotransferase
MLLHTKWSGTVDAFQDSDWESGDDEHAVFYLRPYGQGTVLYLTLGHCRSTYDMQPMVEEYPVLERGSWEVPAYYELLRRGIAWGIQ